MRCVRCVGTDVGTNGNPAEILDLGGVASH
jgi:hypothetical protein